MSADHSNIVRASEIATYCFCHRAWLYQLQGMPSQNEDDLAEGSQYHHQHGRALLTIRTIRVAALILVILAIVLLLLGLSASMLP